MFTKTLLPDTLRAIGIASQIPILKNAYLAGGTSLALQIGHRISVDLDFFTPEEFDENVVATGLLQFETFKEHSRAWSTVLGQIGETKFSIFYYKDKLIDKTIEFEGIHLAGKKDIAAMKLEAIANRGLKRDFIDVFMLSKEFSLDEMLKFYDEKFGILEERKYMIIKGLGYFEDATDATPNMIVPIEWEEVKKFFIDETRRLAHEKLGV